MMFINNISVNFLTLYDQFSKLLKDRFKYKGKMFSLMIHVCYEGNDHCGKKNYNQSFLPCLLGLAISLPSYTHMNHQENGIYCLNK